MTTPKLLLTLAAITLLSILSGLDGQRASAQTPNLSGNWSLDVNITVSGAPATCSFPTRIGDPVIPITFSANQIFANDTDTGGIPFALQGTVTGFHADFTITGFGITPGGGGCSVGSANHRTRYSGDYDSATQTVTGTVDGSGLYYFPNEDPSLLPWNTLLIWTGTFTATFRPAGGHPVFALVIAPPPTNGRVTAPGISCGTGGTGDCTEYYGPGSSVTLTATPRTGYRINSWSGDCASAGFATTCTVTADAAKTASVSFSPIPVQCTVGDWNGTGATKAGAYRAGTWYLDRTGDGTPATLAWGGLPQDRPVVGHWSGGSTTKVGIYRDGMWYLDKDGEGAFDGAAESVSWGGVPGDVPVVGDWNNSGTTKVGIYRNGMWYLDKNGDGAFDGCPAECISWGGLPQDVPVVGDWNNSGATKIGIYRDGTWYLDKDGDGAFDGAAETVNWGGVPGDVPVVGDWNNSGSTKVGIYRDGTWYLDRNGNGVFDSPTETLPWGDLP